MVQRLSPLYLACEDGIPSWSLLEQATRGEIALAASCLAWGHFEPVDPHAEPRLRHLLAHGNRYFSPPDDWPIRARGWGMDPFQQEVLHIVRRRSCLESSELVAAMALLVATQVGNCRPDFPAVATGLLLPAMAYMRRLCGLTDTGLNGLEQNFARTG